MCGDSYLPADRRLVYICSHVYTPTPRRTRRSIGVHLRHGHGYDYEVSSSTGIRRANPIRRRTNPRLEQNFDMDRMGHGPFLDHSYLIDNRAPSPTQVPIPESRSIAVDAARRTRGSATPRQPHEGAA
jgi:hypothetical protein